MVAALVRWRRDWEAARRKAQQAALLAAVEKKQAAAEAAVARAKVELEAVWDYVDSSHLQPLVVTTEVGAISSSTD